MDQGAHSLYGLACFFDRVAKHGEDLRNRERAQVLRPSQINPWSPGYHIVLQCTGKTIELDWAIEKGGIRAVPRDYRCPWERAGGKQ
jgi:hypothetical protein